MIKQHGICFGLEFEKFRNEWYRIKAVRAPFIVVSASMIDCDWRLRETRVKTLSSHFYYQ